MENTYKIKPLRKTETRRFWKGKKADSYVTSLPMEWVKEYIPDYEKKENRVIERTQIDSTILITPQIKEEKPKPLELIMETGNGDQVYYSVISAYLQDYDDICITEKDYNVNLIEKLSSIGDKLPNAYFKGKESDGRYVIKFETKIENIPKKLDEIYMHYETLYSKNQKMFSGSIKESDIETEYKIVTRTENLVDNNVFALKRLFTHVFETFWNKPGILIESGLLRDEDAVDYTAAYKIAGYRSVANILERITDIEKDIFELLKKLRDSKIALPQKNGPDFPKYYDGAHDMIKDAYQSKKLTESASDSKNGFKCLVKVLAAEDNEKDGIRYREKYISFDERKKILDYLKESKKPPELVALEGLIWGSTGLATNIAEAWINMSDLTKIDKIKKDSMSKIKS